MGRINQVLAVSLSAAVMTLAGCEDVQQDAQRVADPIPATVGGMTLQNRSLRDIPTPQSRVTVSVYDLPDLTGQYKETNSGQTLSRSVSQGGAAILVKALLDAGERRWFRVLDRSALENLLSERQIITEMRRIYRGETAVDPETLGPMSHAGLLIEGAVIGYDTNTLTGGVGARYLGIGTDTKWKLDTVTVNLRLMSSESGEVLASVVTRKPIASVSKRGSIFAYVALDQLVEGELGRATNEPKQLALEQAVEKAVMGLIAEGTMAGAWTFSDAAKGDAFIAQYLNAKFDGDVPGSAAAFGKITTPAGVSVPPTIPRAQEETKVQVRQVPPATKPSQSTPPLPPDGAEPGEEPLG